VVCAEGSGVGLGRGLVGSGEIYGRLACIHSRISLLSWDVQPSQECAPARVRRENWMVLV
jgi:hypothetical protein